MFGHHWEPAEGTVIDIRKKGNAQSNGSVSLKFLVEVRPTAADAFRIELGMPGLFGDFIPPHVGQVVKMEVDLSRQDARFDTADPAVSAKPTRRAADQRFDKELSASLTQPTDDAGQAATVSAATVLATGVPVRVVLVQAAPMGRKSAAGVDMYALVLTVEAEGRPEHQALVGNPVPEMCLPLLAPGTHLPARMLSDDPNAVVVDWESAMHMSGTS